MLNKLMLGVALSALALSGAMAQSSPTPNTTPNTPAASSPATPDSSKSSEMNKSSTTGAATTSASTTSSSAKFVSTQNPDQWLASKFKGTDVVGSDDKKIGDVSDILFDKDGKIEAFVVSVGGFLGVGSKDVALAPTAFDVIKGSNGSADKLKLAMSKDELKQAQNFEPYKEPSKTTTGAAGSRPGGMSSTGSAHPATPPASSK